MFDFASVRVNIYTHTRAGKYTHTDGPSVSSQVQGGRSLARAGGPSGHKS